VKRFFKQHFNRFLPDTVRRSLKRRLEKKFHAPVDAHFTLEERNGVLWCKIDNGFSFLAPLACKDQLVRFTTALDGRAEFHTIACAAKQGGALFDIGAHSGVISALFCAARLQNRAFSFEPSPILSRRLSEIRNLNQFGERMSIQPVGIGDTKKVIEMLVDPVGGFVQSQRFEQTMWASPEHIQIQLERIADAAARLNVIPQFIKLDIEGYEYEAIRGSLEFLTHHKPTIFLELHLNYLEERNLSARAVAEMLETCGYGFYSYGGSRLSRRALYDSPLQSIHVVAR
jgi:FkbM family methyltransferase